MRKFIVTFCLLMFSVSAYGQETWRFSGAINEISVQAGSPVIPVSVGDPVEFTFEIEGYIPKPFDSGYEVSGSFAVSAGSNAYAISSISIGNSNFGHEVFLNEEFGAPVIEFVPLKIVREADGFPSGRNLALYEDFSGVFHLSDGSGLPSNELGQVLASYSIDTFEASDDNSGNGSNAVPEPNSMLVWVSLFMLGS